MMNKWELKKLILISLIASSSTVLWASEPVQWNFDGSGGVQILTSSKTPSGSWAVDIYTNGSSDPYQVFTSPNQNDFFGITRTSAGDIDADGYDDVLIGAPTWGKGHQNYGNAHVYSGYSGQELLRIPGFSPSDYFGRSVAGAGDVNGDGVPDLLVAGWYRGNTEGSYGRVYLLSGTDGTLLRTITSYASGDGFGYAIASLGDLNGDDVPEIAISAPLAQTGSLGKGVVYVFDLQLSPSMHLATADADEVIVNGNHLVDYFGSLLAYDDLQSTSSFDVLLVGSVDPASYSSTTAEFVFSRHKLGTTENLGNSTVPSKISGDAIPDGSVSGSDFTLVTSALNQDPAVGDTSQDVDSDGLVTTNDVTIVASNLGASSPLYSMVTDPSALLTRISELTKSQGGLHVMPGDPEPWPDCDDDDDDSDDNDDDNTDGPSIQPDDPGVGDDDQIDGPIGGPENPRTPTLPPDDSTTDPCDDDPPGGSDCGCEMPADPAPDANCDAFVDFGGPNYVGRGLPNDGFYATVTSDDWLAFLVGSSDSGVSTLQSTAAGQNAFEGQATFIDEARTRTLKWVAYNTQTQVVVTKCLTVEVVEYQDFDFKYRAFIPCDVAPGPPVPFGLLCDFYGGDSRHFCTFNWVIFSPAPLSYRASHTSTVACEGDIWNLSSPPYSDSCLEVTENSNILSNEDAPFGLSTGYDNTPVPVVLPTACVPLGSFGTSWCSHDLTAGTAPHQQATLTHVPIVWRATNSDGTSCLYEPNQDGHLNGAYTFRLGPNYVWLSYRLNASLPLVPICTLH